MKQEASTDEMEWDMHYLVADIARTIGVMGFVGQIRQLRRLAAS